MTSVDSQGVSSPSHKIEADFATEESRWQAVIARNPAAEGAFVYSVRTTGVYCRPNCPARRAKREHVAFHNSPQAAEAAGFRPCRRCHPHQQANQNPITQAVQAACRMLTEAERPPNLSQLATVAGLSPSHFQRQFKKHTGITPKQFAQAIRREKVRDLLPGQKSITRAISESGFSSSSRFYESSTALLGMTPQASRSGGSGEKIQFAVGECWLGALLVAASSQGICAIALGDDPEHLVQNLQQRYPQAELVGDDPQFALWMAQVVGLIEQPKQAHHLPLDIQGTAFQQQVWQALREIPPGTTLSYTEMAARLGRPQAVRAVANACAANQLAVAIPCHRVVRTDGSLSGYRWGIERKQALLTCERRNLDDLP